MSRQNKKPSAIQADGFYREKKDLTSKKLYVIIV